MRRMFQAPKTELVAAYDVYDPSAEQAARDLFGGQAKTLEDLTCHFCASAAKVGRTLRWNADKNDFENDREASRLLTGQLRMPYELVKI